MRRPLFTLAFAVMVALPARGVAQAPLVTYCTSPTGEYCASFFTWQVTWPGLLALEGSDPAVTLDGGDIASITDPTQRWIGISALSAKAYVYGSGVSEAGRLTMLAVTEYDGFDCRAGWIGAEAFDGPGAVNFLEGEPSCYAATGVQSSADDIWTLSFLTAASFSSCSVLEGTCVEVPEPSGWLLTLSGLLALAVARRRRVRSA